MTIYSDLLTGNKYQEEFVSGEHGFAFEQHTLNFAAATVKVEYRQSPQPELISLQIAAQITQTAEALKLRAWLKACGYKDTREVSGILNTPNVELWVYLIAPEGLCHTATDTSFFETEEVRDLFVSEKSLFNQLAGYTLEKVQVNSL
jgi:hypothetical protein